MPEFIIKHGFLKYIRRAQSVPILLFFGVLKKYNIEEKERLLNNRIMSLSKQGERNHICTSTLNNWNELLNQFD